jgi:glycerol-3-phosphate dehydrogenase
VLVIGGARNAARRGLDVALVERGVRYLEHGYLHLVFEASRERRILLGIAPHLVRPLRFTWPVYKGARIPLWKLRAGLLLYDLLALFRNVGRHHGLDAAGVAGVEPALARDGLRGGATYFDAATDDARLTIATMLDAALAGATVLNHAEVTALRVTDGRVTGVDVADTLGGRTVEITASCVVNATGPWTDDIRRMEDAAAAPVVLGTKGVHVAVPAHRVGNRGAVTLLAGDGRVMFVLPAGTCTIIGTTDTATVERPDEVRAARADVDYLLAAANRAFPAAALTGDDVIAAWAGIRPLIAHGNAGDPSSASREHAVDVGPHGVITVSGGKLTTYRVIAADVLRAVFRALGRPAARDRTADLPLAGGDIHDLNAELAAARAATGADDIATRLVHAYGGAWHQVWARAQAEPSLGARLAKGLPFIAAEVLHAVEAELACTVADVLLRRLHLAFEIKDQGLAVAPRVAALMAPLLGWTDRGIEAAVEDYAREVRRIFTIGA